MRCLGSVQTIENNLLSTEDMKELRIELENKLNNECDNKINDNDNNDSQLEHKSHSRSHVRDDSLTRSLSNASAAEFEEDVDSNRTDNNGFSTNENGDSLHLARIVETKNKNKNDNDNDNDESTDGWLIDNAFGASDLVRQDVLHSLKNRAYLGGDVSNMQQLNNYIDNESCNSPFGNGNCYGYWL